VTDLNTARPRLLLALVGLAVLVVGAARLSFAITEPLWFDEAFTLSIISPPEAAGFWREVYLDPNGPAYYLLMRAWAGVFGDSNLALRVPSLLAIWVAAALPILIPLQGLSRGARLTWAALIFAWWGVGFFLDARCYAILLAVSVFQALTFGRLMERPGLQRALLWTATAAAAILLHYYAVFFAFAQGLIYLGRNRWLAVRTWPAALAFAPAFGWIAYHAPRLSEYSNLGSVWHPPMDLMTVFNVAAFLIFPTNALVVALIAVILATGLLLRRRQLRAAETGPPPQALVLTAAAAPIAFALAVGFGLLGSGLSPRYLMPLAPTLLLGGVLLAGAGPSPGLAWTALVGVFFAAQAGPVGEALTSPHPLPRYEFETGAKFLMENDLTELVFVWDHEVAPIMARDTMRRLGGVFFERADQPVEIHVLAVSPAHNPNLQIAAAAQDAGTGFIWLYNRRGQTAAQRFAPTVGLGDPAWRCIQGGDGMAGSLTCFRHPPS
jgi:hypothetical protein